MKKADKERRATYTVKVPIKFTFSASNWLDCGDLIKEAIKETYRRLESGYFDVLEAELEIPDKITHYTRAEIAERNKYWEEILKGIVPGVAK